MDSHAVLVAGPVDLVEEYAVVPVSGHAVGYAAAVGASAVSVVVALVVEGSHNGPGPVRQLVVEDRGSGS